MSTAVEDPDEFHRPHTTTSHYDDVDEEEEAGVVAMETHPDDGSRFSTSLK